MNSKKTKVTPNKPPSMPEETGKSKVASWLTSQGLKKDSGEGKSEGKTETKKQEVMTLSDSDDVQTISSGSDEKDKEKITVTKKQVAVKSTRGIGLKTSYGMMVKTGGAGAGGRGSGRKTTNPRRQRQWTPKHALILRRRGVLLHHRCQARRQSRALPQSQLQSKPFRPECLCGHTRLALSLGSVLCQQTYPSWHRADVGL
ncbi:hypothetical protein NQD34_012310 [Periophthalmus magnuspinnatus]|nr:hypothetical protein NQD34_012310 [Periophthalmus magnuspinnatus]